MGQPADGKTLQLSEAVELVTGLPLKEVYDWLSDHQLNQAAPVDLRRVKPDSALLEEVFLGTRPVQGLADAEVRALHYAVPALDVAGQPGAGVSTATADDVGTIRSGLQKKAAGKWTLKYVCSHASKCSCPYTLELRHPAGSEVVSVWQTAPHQFHDPTSADSQAQLRMHPRLEAMATVMIESGATPTSICTRLNNMVHDPADPLGLGGGTTGLQHFSSARVSIIPRQIYVLIKKLRRAEGLGLTSDVQAMAVLIDELRREGSVLFYQPYKQAGRRSGEQPLVIVMQVSFQARMLDQFGRRLVFMDATFGVNKYGYPLYALVVQDESGRGVPVSFMVCSSDTAEVVEHFLRTSMEGAQAAGDGTFKYKSIMIDKSKTEIAAVDQLVSTGHAEGYLLCYFHFLQDWELDDGLSGSPRGSGRLLQPPGQAPPDITVAVPHGGANGAHAYVPPATNSSHLGDSDAGEGVGGPAGGAASGSDLWTSLSGNFSRGGGGGGGWRSAARKLFSRGHDMESAGVNHTYTGEEKARLKQFQSIDYLAPSSRVYRQWLAAQPWGRYWDRWLMMALSGMAVGLVGFFLHFFIHVLSATKYHGTRWLLAHTHVVVGWMFNITFSLGLVYASTWLVINVAPEAAGAGVAEITAYLNGCFMPKARTILNIKTFAVKFLSAATAVGSGLPVGPEGPMIHMGAAVGAGISQGHSTTLGIDTGLFRHFQNPKDKRDFATAGAAMGVAVAFSAPIGGLLFVLEEIASFWQQASHPAGAGARRARMPSLGWQIFFACMMAVLTSDTMRSAQAAWGEGQFGLFDKESSTVFFEVQTQLTNHVLMVLPAAAIGIIAGLCAILFTILNLKASCCCCRAVVRARNEFFKGKPAKWRMAEPCLLIIIFCVIIQGETKPLCPDGTSERIKRIVEESTELYTCSRTARDSEIPPEWDPDGAGGISGNITVPRSYNELATLMSVTAGSAISSGVFVPMLLIGACIGRLVGLIGVDIAAARGLGSEGAPPGVFLPPSPWAWIDPGAFALIGAGAFMGGVTRMTLALAVIIMEMSNDVRILLPTMVAIMLAKFVADSATHSLYHGLLEVKCVPFLPKEPATHMSLDLVEVRYVMHAPVVTLHEQMRLGDVRDVLRKTRHNGFPVVRDTPQGGVCVGLVVRDHLMKLLVEAVKRGTCQHLEVPFSELNRQFVDASALESEAAQQMAVLEGRPLTPSHFPNDPNLWDETLDLTPYINSSAIRVPESYTLERAYILFSTMGLRHLVVVDEHNRVRGMVTRKDLLGYRLDEAAKRARVGMQPQPAGSGGVESPHHLETPRLGPLMPSDATPDRF
ncbi:hypothetical protein CHLNCDRAFT_144489 [Chlorella variabilis]|uniref:Chloride channel protein n=1 Tax=Chlorella variabilis TaxID=554065 RepID=E1ZBJ0_CHLVA|nr:hypothetical protein CHLNCDRAFT_144489 [Chlorella variabilis]EFN56864.1 hypothetical protein CHLNCDRAFT_144489 [Chlorella variabilis]|eukprot:XP_005848966.1 hypothetical protein CHLNCDRAFT_144489 [Chlorella variabilis]